MADTKFLIASLTFALFCATSPNPLFPQKISPDAHPKLLIAECAQDGIYASIPDGEGPSRARIARIGDIDVEAQFIPPDGDGATFWFVRNGKTISSFIEKKLTASWVWIAVDHDINSPEEHDRIALTYSDGGAIGGFHVRVFQVTDDVVTDVSNAIEGAVSDFKARHYCKSRGNNITALKWIKGDLLLMTEVYPTGDCGPDLGHIEAYRVSVPDGKIRERLTLDQLKSYPGVCLQIEHDN